MEGIVGQIQAGIATLGIKIILAILIFVVGRWAAKITKEIVERLMSKSNVDPTLINFVGNLTYIVVIAFAVLAALAKLGIQTTSFIAILGAAGLAVGLALQGSLSNFAAGVLLIIFRPFKVGDLVEAGGATGTVEHIQIFTTQLKTPDNKTIIIPNSNVTGNNIVNISAKDIRRVDMTFGIGYGDDIDKARSVIAEVLSKDDRILKDPEVTVAVAELADSSVNFAVRPWVNRDDYWGVLFDTTEAMKKRFDEEGISIPFPQRDVHLSKEE